MGVVVASTTALSVAANAKSADVVAGTYQFLPFPQGADLTLAARGSATGLNVTLVADGTTLVNDQALPYSGTAGAIDVEANEIASFPDLPAGTRLELTLRNTTGGALTCDLLLVAEPN